MFDKLIETEPAGADFKNRRKYFMMSTVCVGILFTTAVVFSIYAAEVGLGNSDFELSEIIAPPYLRTDEPEPPQMERSRHQTQTLSQLVTRQVNMARVDEVIREIPNAVSTTQNTQQERPKYGSFQISNVDSGRVEGQTSGRDTNGVVTADSGISSSRTQVSTVIEKDSEIPPPVIKKPAPPVSRGVLNGIAKNLPKPVYSAAAKAVNAQGQVNVQVMIDESGRVISANAVSGHVLLRAESEKAARGARFSPTLLSDVPVKVTGVITYNFVR